MVFPLDTFVHPKGKKKVLKTKAKSHPYIFSVSGSICPDTFSTKLPGLEMLIRSPTPLHQVSHLLGPCGDAPWGCNSSSQCPHGSATALNTLSMCCAEGGPADPLIGRPQFPFLIIQQHLTLPGSGHPYTLCPKKLCGFGIPLGRGQQPQCSCQHCQPRAGDMAGQSSSSALASHLSQGTSHQLSQHTSVASRTMRVPSI